MGELERQAVELEAEVGRAGGAAPGGTGKGREGWWPGGRPLTASLSQNQKLLAENRRLRERAQSLSRENHDLRLRLGLPALKVRVGRQAGRRRGGRLGARLGPSHPAPFPAGGIAGGDSEHRPWGGRDRVL